MKKPFGKRAPWIWAVELVRGAAVDHDKKKAQRITTKQEAQKQCENHA